MKKLLITLTCVLLSIATSQAVMLSEGTSELALSGGVDFDSASGAKIDINVYYGYFLQDYLQAGLKLNLYNDNDFTIWALGPRGELNFDIGIELVPFVAGSLVFAIIDGPSGYGDKNALIFGVEGGAKYFVTEYFALSAALAFDLATDNIYDGENNKRKSYDARLEFGIRTFF